jgi:hypothetical protein
VPIRLLLHQSLRGFTSKTVVERHRIRIVVMKASAFHVIAPQSCNIADNIVTAMLQPHQCSDACMQ